MFLTSYIWALCFIVNFSYAMDTANFIDSSRKIKADTPIIISMYTEALKGSTQKTFAHNLFDSVARDQSPFQGSSTTSSSSAGSPPSLGDFSDAIGQGEQSLVCEVYSLSSDDSNSSHQTVLLPHVGSSSVDCFLQLNTLLLGYSQERIQDLRLYLMTQEFAADAKGMFLADLDFKQGLDEIRQLYSEGDQHAIQNGWNRLKVLASNFSSVRKIERVLSLPEDELLMQDVHLLDSLYKNAIIMQELYRAGGHQYIRFKVLFNAIDACDRKLLLLDCLLEKLACQQFESSLLYDLQLLKEVYGLAQGYGPYSFRRLQLLVANPDNLKKLSRCFDFENDTTLFGQDLDGLLWAYQLANADYESSGEQVGKGIFNEDLDWSEDVLSYEDEISKYFIKQSFKELLKDTQFSSLHEKNIRSLEECIEVALDYFIDQHDSFDISGLSSFFIYGGDTVRQSVKEYLQRKIVDLYSQDREKGFILLCGTLNLFGNDLFAGESVDESISNDWALWGDVDQVINLYWNLDGPLGGQTLFSRLTQAIGARAQKEDELVRLSVLFCMYLPYLQPGARKLLTDDLICSMLSNESINNEYAMFFAQDSTGYGLDYPWSRIMAYKNDASKILSIYQSDYRDMSVPFVHLTNIIDSYRHDLFNPRNFLSVLCLLNVHLDTVPQEKRDLLIYDIFRSYPLRKKVVSQDSKQANASIKKSSSKIIKDDTFGGFKHGDKDDQNSDPAQPIDPSIQALQRILRDQLPNVSQAKMAILTQDILKLLKPDLEESKFKPSPSIRDEDSFFMNRSIGFGKTKQNAKSALKKVPSANHAILGWLAITYGTKYKVSIAEYLCKEDENGNKRTFEDIPREYVTYLNPNYEGHKKIIEILRNTKITKTDEQGQKYRISLLSSYHQQGIFKDIPLKLPSPEKVIPKQHKKKKSWFGTWSSKKNISVSASPKPSVPRLDLSKNSSSGFTASQSFRVSSDETGSYCLEDSSRSFGPQSAALSTRTSFGSSRPPVSELYQDGSGTIRRKASTSSFVSQLPALSTRTTSGFGRSPSTLIDDSDEQGSIKRTTSNSSFGSQSGILPSNSSLGFDRSPSRSIGDSNVPGPLTRPTSNNLFGFPRTESTSFGNKDTINRTPSNLSLRSRGHKRSQTFTDINVLPELLSEFESQTGKDSLNRTPSNHSFRSRGHRRSQTFTDSEVNPELLSDNTRGHRTTHNHGQQQRNSLGGAKKKRPLKRSSTIRSYSSSQASGFN